MISLVYNICFCKLEALLSSMICKPGLISVTETWIKRHSLESFLNLARYNLVHNSRPTCKGGGVPFYVRDTIEFHVTNQLTIIYEKFFESSNQISDKKTKL